MALPQGTMIWTAAGMVLCGVFVVVARVVYQTERLALDNLEERFRMRAEIAEPFLRSYVQDVLVRERRVAQRELSAPTISYSSFEKVVSAFDFKAAVLTDAAGRLVQVFPTKPELIGTDVAGRYAHLRKALADGVAVSTVVSSAALATPIVGFATRYETPSGARVFSGAYDVSLTPIDAYMFNLLAIKRATADLVDEHGIIVASNRTRGTETRDLERLDPALMAALRIAPRGQYEGRHGSTIYVSRNVGGTPWRLLLAVDERALYAPLEGKRRWVYWWLFGAFCAATTVAAFMLKRLNASRDALKAMNAMLARLARMDRLTDVPNRLYLEEELIRLRSASIRHARPLSVLLVDVDHFKSVNDAHGHDAGDEVLRCLAERMAASLRAEDMFGRWGGEEFLAILPNTDAAGAAIVADRVRVAAGFSPVRLGSGESLLVTVSIGCATTGGSRDESFIQRADSALYRAKSLGRDCVVSDAPPRAASELTTSPTG